VKGPYVVCYYCHARIPLSTAVRLLDIYLCSNCAGQFHVETDRYPKELMFRGSLQRSHAMSENNGPEEPTAPRRKQFGDRSRGSFLTAAHLAHDGVWDVTVEETTVIPANTALGIDESDGLQVKCPDGHTRTFRLGARSTEAIMAAIPDARDTDGLSVVGATLKLTYMPNAYQGKAGIVISKVTPRAG